MFPSEKATFWGSHFTGVFLVAANFGHLGCLAGSRPSCPGDSCHPQTLEVTNNHLKGSRFHHPKKVAIAELPGI